MSRSKKQRIDTSPSQTGLNNPFAGLEATGLPQKKVVPPVPASPPRSQPRPAKLGRVVLRRETARRGGKTVVVIYEFAPHLSLAYIEELSRRLRKAVGCGGTARGRVVEIQGDQPERIRAWLEAEGFRVAGLTHQTVG